MPNISNIPSHFWALIGSKMGFLAKKRKILLSAKISIKVYFARTVISIWFVINNYWISLSTTRSTFIN